MSRRLMHFAAPALVVAVTAGAALAQESQPPPADLEPEPALTISSDPRDWGLSVSAGVGVTAFFDGDTQRVAHAGALWDVRVAIGTDAPFGVELAYVGSVQPLDGLREEDDAFLFGNGAELTVRADVPIALVRPYLMVGIGWMHYHIAYAESALTNLERDENAWVMPVGAGVRYRTGSILLDVRGTFRPTVVGSLTSAPALDAPDTALDSWAMTGRAGYVF